MNISTNLNLWTNPCQSPLPKIYPDERLTTDPGIRPNRRPWKTSLGGGTGPANTIHPHGEEKVLGSVDGLHPDHTHLLVHLHPLGISIAVRPRPVSVPPWAHRPKHHGAALQAEMPVLVARHGCGETHAAGALPRGVDRTREGPEGAAKAYRGSGSRRSNEACGAIANAGARG